MLTYPTLDPVALQLGPLSIRWYGLAYMAGILLGWQWGVWLCQRLKLSFGLSQTASSSKLFSDYIPYAVLGIVLGGRVGHALFYHASYYLYKPWEVFYIWQPGMSFHGGLIGVLITTFWYVRRHQLAWRPFLDLLAVCTPIGIFFGRVANFVNAELVGRPTDVPWAMIFPNTDGVPRHPSQVYEALLEGIGLFVILNLLFRRCRHYPGVTAGLFGVGYGAARIFVECYREPDSHIGYIGQVFTVGQLYSLPLVIIGLILIWQGRCTTSSIKPL